MKRTSNGKIANVYSKLNNLYLIHKAVRHKELRNNYKVVGIYITTLLYLN